MKTSITTLMAMIAGSCIVAAAGIYPPITTTDGKTYDHITTQRTDPDGLYIEYTLPGNGMGAAKVKFSRLSSRLRKLCGYNASAGRQYEEDAYAGELAYQAWADQQAAARQKAKADAYAYEVQEATMMAQQAPAPGLQAATATHLIIYSGGAIYSGPGQGNSRTVTTYQGFVPQTPSISPPAFNTRKTELLPGNPSFSRSFSMGSARMR